MAIGFTPKHEEFFDFSPLTAQAFLALSINTIEKLGWTLTHVSAAGLIAQTKMGFMYTTEFSLRIGEESGILKSESTGGEMADFGKNKDSVTAFIATFQDLKATAEPAHLSLYYESIKHNFPMPEEDILLLKPTTWREDILDFLVLFKPSEDYFVTPILMDLNILVFLIMVFAGVGFFAPDNAGLIAWGANLRSLTLNGEPWRLLTCCFVHIGVFHLIMNLFALLFIGILLEPFLGKSRFAAAYLLTGIAASAFSLWWHGNVVSAGASGAIFGLYGVFLAILTTNLIEKEERNGLLVSIGFFVAYNLFMGLRGGVDNAGHIGGLLSGLVVGYAYIFSLKDWENTAKKIAAISLSAILIFVACAWVYTHTKDDWGIYSKKMDVFYANESHAVAVFDDTKGLPNDSIVARLKTQGNDLWQGNLQILKDLDALDLTETVALRNTKLRKYCLLRLKSYNLLHKAYAENTDRYETEIVACNAEIKTALDDLNEKEAEE
jgi:rhomboid protease GluP